MNALDALAIPLTGTALIEASAGTGKTYTITTLVLRLLVERRLPIRQVLVVTFTQAAAAELRDRVRRRLGETLAAIERGAGFEHDPELKAWLEQRRDPDVLEGDRSCLQRALRDFDEAAICTIHAFCQRVLSEHAFESHIPFDTQLLEQQAPLLEEVTFDYWAKTAYRAEPNLLRSLRGRAGPDKLLSLAAKVMRDPAMAVVPDAPPARTLSDARWEAARHRAAELWKADRAVILEQLCRPERLHRRSHPPERIAAVWAHELDGLAQCQPLQLPSCIERLTEAALLKATRKQQVAPSHPFFAAVSELVQAHDALRALFDEHVLSVRRNLVDYVRSEVAKRRRRLGVQGFDDLLLQLHAALHGPAGDVLARKLAARHPVALIDEFQDTDPVQYEIFLRLYGDGGTLFLIGDPKQAIYGFRGADIFAYLQAARAAGENTHTLAVNHRSDPRLIHAINRLFARPQRPFLFREIRFQAVRARAGAREHMSPDQPALQLLFVPRELANTGEPKRPITKGWGDRQLPRLVAAEIVQLLHDAPNIGDVPLHPSHIAVLCRTNNQARDLARELSRLGVPTVLDGDSSVFESDMAEELSRVLWSIARPADARKLGAALASSLFGVDGLALFRMRNAEADLELWLERLTRWNLLWHERGFIQMWHQLLEEAGVRTRLLSRADGERRLTDLLHLAELLHGAATEQHLGPLSLLHWFTQMRVDPQSRASLAADSAQLRLEHDEHALKLTTIHRSKGLEYPIVFCPFSWADCTGADEEVCFHDREDGDRIKLDLGSAELEAHTALSQREALAEHLRLLYVALTRARHRCYVVWGRFNRGGRSPLGYLLHARPGEDDPQLDAVEEHLAPLSDAELRSELQALCTASEGTIGVRDITLHEPDNYRAAEPSSGALSARTSTRKLSHAPRMTSFSRLTSQLDLEVSAAEERFEHEPDSELEQFAALRDGDPSVNERVVLADFPAGSGPGSLIHSVYEQIDFRRVDPEELPRQVELSLAAYGVDSSHAAALTAGIAASLQTPLARDGVSLTIDRIAPRERRAELEFMLHTGACQTGLGARLCTAFERHAAPHAAPGYVTSLRTLDPHASAGFLRGFIDLVFRHDGRYFIVDYKSNHLGDRASDYRSERVIAAMEEHHYFLQYHLYALALHRHLNLRLPGYDFERCFGGVYYLFLRGMAPSHPPGTGVFFDRPSLALLDDIAAALGAEGAGR